MMTTILQQSKQLAHALPSSAVVGHHTQRYGFRIVGHQMVHNYLVNLRRRSHSTTAKTAQHFDHSYSSSIFLKEKKNWLRTRFGGLDHTHLVLLKEVAAAPHWPVDDRSMSDDYDHSYKTSISLGEKKNCVRTRFGRLDYTHFGLLKDVVPTIHSHKSLISLDEEKSLVPTRFGNLHHSNLALLKDVFPTAHCPVDQSMNHDHSHNSSLSLDEKKSWVRTRFGHLDHTSLGLLKDVPTPHWPAEHSITFLSSKGHLLHYRMCNVDSEAERIAEIYQKAIDEIHGNSDYEWHHSPDQIRRNVAQGNYSIWGTYDLYDNNKLIAVNSAEFMQGQRGIHWIWGAVDPDCRGRGVWENVGIFMDSMMQKSDAQYGLVWMATTHDLSQRMIEKVPGWQPVGFFRGGELLAGTDGKYYRQNVVWYSKLFGEATAVTQSLDDMVLTEAAKKVADAVLSSENGISEE